MKRALPLVLLAASACTSYTTHLGAKPIEAGKTEVGVAVSGLVAERANTPALLPQGEVSIRHGLSEDLDAGLELSALGAELNLRLSFFQGENVVLAVVPSAGIEIAPLTSSDSDLWMLRFGSTLLMDVAVAPKLTAVLGLKPLFAIGPRPGIWSDDPLRARVIFAPGVMIGCRLALSDRWAVFPEIDLHLPWDLSDNVLHRPIVQGGLGLDFKFGG